MDPLHIDIQALKESIDAPWSPVDVVEWNDYIVRLAKFDGEYHWHSHTNEDELFYVAEGQITIQIENSSDLILTEGQMGMVPKGVRHCPKSNGAFVLMFEPKTLDSSGS